MFSADDLQYEVFPERGNRIMRGWSGRKRVWRWLAVFMAALLTAVSVSTTALAAETDSESYSANGNNSEDDYSDSGSSQQKLYWMYDYGTLYLFDEEGYNAAYQAEPETFSDIQVTAMEDYSVEGEAPWSQYADEIKIIRVLGDIYIGDYAFYYFTNLNSIQILYGSDEYDVETAIEIGESVFSGCEELKTIAEEVSKEVVSIGENAFFGCTSLEKIWLSSDVTEISKDAFAECKGLTINYGGTISSWEEINEDLDTYDTWDIQVNYGLVNYGTWGQTNIEDSLTSSEYIKVLGLIQGAILYGLKSGQEEKGHGLCFGMTMTAAAILYYNYPSVNTFYNGEDAAESLYEIKDANEWMNVYMGMTAQQYIRYAYIYQFTDSYSADKAFNRTADLDDLAEAALLFKKYGSNQAVGSYPIEINIGDILNNENEYHSLLVVDVGENNDSELELIVYDPNFYEYTQSLYLIKDEETGEITGWIYETYNGNENMGGIWGSEQGESLYWDSAYFEDFIERFVDDFEAQIYCNLFTTKRFQADLYLISSKIGVTLQGSSTEGAEDVVTYILSSDVTDEGSGGDGSAYAYWIEGEEEVVVTVPEGGGSYSYSAYTSGVSVELSDAAEVTLRSGNEIEDVIWITNSLDQEYVMEFAVAEDVDEDFEEEYVVILVSGQTSGDVSGRLTEEGVVLSGDIAAGTELTLEIDGETVYTLIVTQEVIDASEESLTVIRTDEETLVIGTLSDSDADPNTDESNDTESDGDEGGSDSSDTTDTEDAQTMEEESETGTDSGESEASSDDTSTGETEDSGTNEGTDDADTEEITETESTTADAGTSSTDATESGATAISEDASETQAEGSQTAADPEGSGSDAEIAETEMLSEEEENNSDAGIDRGAAATGDDGDVNFWLVLMLVTAAGLGTAVYVMRRQKRQG